MSFGEETTLIVAEFRVISSGVTMTRPLLPKRSTAHLLRRCSGALMMLVASLAAVGWGAVPVTLTSGNVMLSVGADTIIHDAYIRVPLGLFAVPVFILGLVLALVPLGERA